MDSGCGLVIYYRPSGIRTSHYSGHIVIQDTLICPNNVQIIEEWTISELTNNNIVMCSFQMLTICDYLDILLSLSGQINTPVHSMACYLADSVLLHPELSW